MLKNIALSISLLIPAIAQAGVRPISHPSPNSGTITPSAITTGAGSFSGSVTASSVTAQTATLGNGTLAVPAIVGTDADSGVIFGGSGFSAKSLVYVRDGLGMWYFDNNELQYAGTTAPARIDAQTRMRIYSSVSSVALSTSATDGADNLRVNADGSLVINPQGQGSVGIGTASPCSTCTLHVAGGASVTGGLGFGMRTKAQFSAANGVVGQAWLCTDCVIPYSLCVGTGTTLSGWKVSYSATVGCGTNN